MMLDLVKRAKKKCAKEFGYEYKFGHARAF
jgi:hypothetical protein